MGNVDTSPNPWFYVINSNQTFFLSTVSNYLTEAIANTKYLLSSDANYMTGNLGIKE